MPRSVAWKPAAPRYRGLVLVLLVLLHGALGTWLMHTLAPTGTQDTALTAARRFGPVWVRLAPLAPAASPELAPEPQLQSRKPTSAATALARRPDPELPSPARAPQAITDPARLPSQTALQAPAPPAPLQGEGADAGARPPPTGPLPTPAPPPLDLRLPPAFRPLGRPEPRTLAQQAVEARVGGARRGTAEERMGRRLDSVWTEEILPDGRVRMRRGDDCLIFSEARAAQIDPWNNRGTMPRGGTSCPPP